MLQEIIKFIIRNIGLLFILLLLIRFYMQAARVPFQYTFGRFILKMTNFIVLPVRRVIPALMGFDTASILVAWAVALIMHIALLMIAPWPYDLLAPSSILALLLWALLEILSLSLSLLTAVVVGLVILSWVSPMNRLLPLLLQVAEPFLRPLRRIIPPIAGVDVSPVVLFFFIQLIQSVLFVRLESTISELIVRIGA